MLSFIKKVNAFIKRYYPEYLGYIVRYGFARISPNYPTYAEFYSDREFFDELKKGKSIIRLGDGEAGLLHGRDIHYQKHSKDLENDLKEIIKDYTESSPYLLCIPLFVGYTNKRLRKLHLGVFNCWLPFKIAFKEYFNKNIIYVDQHFSYYQNKVNTIFEKYIYNKNVLIVTKKQDIDILNKIQKEKKLFNKLSMIESPSEESYSKKDSIYNEIIKENSKHNFDVVVLACGPLSKVLAYKLSKENICSYDIGLGLRYLWEGEDFSYKI